MLLPSQCSSFMQSAVSFKDCLESGCGAEPGRAHGPKLPGNLGPWALLSSTPQGGLQELKHLDVTVLDVILRSLERC